MQYNRVSWPCAALADCNKINKISHLHHIVAQKVNKIMNYTYSSETIPYTISTTGTTTSFSATNIGTTTATHYTIPYYPTVDSERCERHCIVLNRKYHPSQLKAYVATRCDIQIVRTLISPQYPYWSARIYILWHSPAIHHVMLTEALPDEIREFVAWAAEKVMP